MLIGEFFPPPGDAGEFHRDGPIALAVQEFQMPQQQTSLQRDDDISDPYKR
jgi:hypothetical protein